MTAPLFQSLDKWLSLWNKRISQPQPVLEARPLIDRDQPAVRAGFVRHSHEFYTLALAKLEMIDRLHGVGQASHIGDAGKGNVKQLISDIKRAWPTRAEAARAV